MYLVTVTASVAQSQTSDNGVRMEILGPADSGGQFR